MRFILMHKMLNKKRVPLEWRWQDLDLVNQIIKLFVLVASVFRSWLLMNATVKRYRFQMEPINMMRRVLIEWVKKWKKNQDFIDKLEVIFVFSQIPMNCRKQLTHCKSTCWYFSFDYPRCSDILTFFGCFIQNFGWRHYFRSFFLLIVFLICFSHFFRVYNIFSSCVWMLQIEANDCVDWWDELMDLTLRSLMNKWINSSLGFFMHSVEFWEWLIYYISHLWLYGHNKLINTGRRLMYVYFEQFLVSSNCDRCSIV